MSQFWDKWRPKSRAAHVVAETKLRKQRELEYLASLPDVPFDPNRPSGVLLSDEIEYYATNFKLIDPFDTKKLTGARYELSVGELYSIGGNTHILTDDPGKNEILIKPFEVAVIQTLERLNMPHFMIARWNVRIRWAYKGLLWVGGPQVDAGYRGFLDCPLYNLSNQPVRLRRGEEIAVIDFVTTTPQTERSRKFQYDPSRRTRVLFEEYEPDLLESALSRLAREKIEVFEDRINKLQDTVTNSVGIILTAIGVLVAALAFFIGRSSEIAWPPSLIVATVAMVLSLFTFIRTHKDNRPWFNWCLAASVVLLALLAWASVRAISTQPSRTPSVQSTPGNNGPAPHS